MKEDEEEQFRSSDEDLLVIQDHFTIYQQL